MAKGDFDLCVIGGGINGAGIARDAAGRGLSVLLVEAQDLANATSSSSTKLIHGGLRYLEYYEFRLVREALKERETLLAMAPHIIRPLEFVLPHDAHLRPAWMIRAGLFLYDHLAGRHRLAHSKSMNFSWHPYGSPLDNRYKRGFSYADCWVDDARLVVLNAMDAEAKGATILTRMACTRLEPQDGCWKVSLRNLATGQDRAIVADKIVNAAGPWVYDVLAASHLTTPETPRIRLVKGSHIIIPRLYEGDQCYILQQKDRRIVFAIPYEKNFTLIGTTDVDFKGDPMSAQIENQEISYLCRAVNDSFNSHIGTAHIVHTYSGVRALFDDGTDNASSVTRDYKLIHDSINGGEILSVFGGKITTYRKLAEQAVSKLTKKKPWTAGTILPGGDIPDGDMARFIEAQQMKYRWLPSSLLHHYATHYGTYMEKIIRQAQDLSGLGQNLGDDLYMAEIEYLVGYEWARTSEDILYRRTKRGLHISDNTARNLENSLQAILSKGYRHEKTRSTGH